MKDCKNADGSKPCEEPHCFCPPPRGAAERRTTLLTALEILEAQATPGPWEADGAVDTDGKVTRAIYHRPARNHIVEVIESPVAGGDDECIHNDGDHLFIVALRNAWPQIRDALSARSAGERTDADFLRFIAKDYEYNVPSPIYDRLMKIASSLPSSEQVKVCPRCGDAAKCSAPGCPLAAPAEAVATPDVTDEQLAALRAKYPQDHVATETVLDVLESSAAPAAPVNTEENNVGAKRHDISLAGQAINLTMKLLREIARRSPEVLQYTDIEAFITMELEPAREMAEKDRRSCGSLMGLLAEARRTTSASGGRRQPCRAPSATMTMSLRADEWYCHGCGANQAEPECRYLKSAPDRGNDRG